MRNEGSAQPFHERKDPPRMGEPGWLPDHGEERQTDFGATTPGERIAEAIAISRTATKIAAAAQRRRDR